MENVAKQVRVTSVLRRARRIQFLTLRMRAIPKSATRDDLSRDLSFSAEFETRLFSLSISQLLRQIPMTTFMDVIGSQECPKPFGNTGVENIPAQ
jgi:hypothetical protein